MTHHHYDVVVIGGGMVGATMALSLSRAGFSIALLERQKPEFSPQSPVGLRVSALTPYTVQYLRNLGVWQVIQHTERAYSVDAMVVLSEHRNQVTLTDEKPVASVVENQITQWAVWQVLQEEEGVDIYLQGNWLDYACDANGVTVRLSTDSSISAQLLVGSDGAQSRVRQLADIDFTVRDYGQICVVGQVKTERNNQRRCWQNYSQQGCFAFLTMGDYWSSMAWYLPADKLSWVNGLSQADCLQALSQYSDGILGTIEAVGSWAAFPLKGGQADSYCQHRVVLIGDAAHAIHPQAGHGVNLGMLDAACLTDCLVHARDRGMDIGRLSVLKHYEHQRYLDNELVIRAMESCSAFFDFDNPLMAPVRQVGMQGLHRSAFLKRQLSRVAISPRFAVPAVMR